MPSEVTGTRVRRVSFVSRAATRDPLNPDEPRRVLLWKAEGSPDDERINILTELEKRAIDRDPTEPAPADGTIMTVEEIEAVQQKLAPMMNDAHDTLTKLRRDPTASPEAEAQAEKRHSELHDLYNRLDGLRGVAKAHARVPFAKLEDSLIVKAAEMRKADSSLSRLEAIKAAVRANPDLYFQQSGTARPVASVGIAKADAEADRRTDESSVERRAKQLESQGLRPTAAYAKALREGGHYAGVAAA
jgi:hypothetical protein